MIKFFCRFFILFFGIQLSACAQDIPEKRPTIEKKDFDDRLTTLLNFTVPLLGVDELKEQQEDWYILDAREKEEYQVSHIPNARYIGYKKFEEAMLEDIPKNAKVVVYCSVGYRSEKIGEKLKVAGYENIYNLYGSIFEWVNAGNEVEDDNGQKTNRIHTYNKKWSQWVIDGRAEKVY